MNSGKSIRLFLADGTPGGLITAEIGNWTGQVITAPRSEISTLIKRPDVSGTGLYILLGEDPEKLGGELAYIGEAEEISKRIRQHSRDESSGGKDFWNKVLIITSKDMNLNKAHVKYLESRLIELAKHSQRAGLLNSTSPPRPALSEADVSDMEHFISELLIILPVLNVNLLRSRNSQLSIKNQDNNAAANSPIFELKLIKEGITSQAQEIDGEFTVLEGSLARREWFGVGTNYKFLRTRLENEGSIHVPENGLAVFTRDVVFASPSAAAAVIVCRNANGRRAWKVKDSGLRYRDWQDSADNID